MSTHQALSALITRNKAVDESTNRLSQFLVQRSVPNTAYAEADQTVIGTTLAASTYLNIANGVGFNGGQAVVGGRKYRLEGRLFTTSTASNGLKFDANAGTATFGNVRGLYLGFASATVAASATVTALTTALSSTNTILEAQIDVSLEASGSGSIGLRFAESANSTGVILLRGSWLSLTEIAS
jgi:hypothetical protein